MRDLTGAGHSTLGVDGALRARDVNRPTAADLEAAEQEVQLVRRNWSPPPAPPPTTPPTTATTPPTTPTPPAGR